MTRHPVIILSALALCVLMACRPEPASVPNTPTTAARSGTELFQSCLLCHSTREMQRGPVIDGLPAWYVARQLQKFHDGTRGKRPENRSEYLMASGMTTLTNQHEFAIVARHIAGLPPQKHLQTVKGDADRGRVLYAQCIACHGARGEGNRTLNSPPLNTLEDWYQLDQLIRFQQGLRGYHTNDVEGIAMRIAVQSMTSEDFRNIVRYIADEFLW